MLEFAIRYSQVNNSILVTTAPPIGNKKNPGAKSRFVLLIMSANQMKSSRLTRVVSISEMRLRSWRVYAGETDNSSIPTFIKKGRRTSSLASSPQMPTGMPALWALSAISLISLVTDL